MFSKLMRSLLMVALLALTACTSGMVLGGGASCEGSTVLLTQVTGKCTRTFDELAEPVDESIAVQTADIAPFTTVDIEVTVESGTVAVTFTDFHGNEQTTEVTARNPGADSIRIQLDPLNRINFKLAPVDGPAEGVHYELNFVCDCMP
jgi:hypothetical protein